jgi:8-oxo-dGTP pyrophosphatase MutT (NUDIX family)
MSDRPDPQSDLQANFRTDESFGIVPIARRSDGHLFLLIQHKAGHWGFPKGHAEPGESAQGAACREFAEETGIQTYELLDATFVEQYNFTKAGHVFSKTVTYFPAVVHSQTVNCQAKEVRDYAWLAYDEALAKLTFTQSRQILMQVQGYLQAQSSY